MKQQIYLTYYKTMQGIRTIAKYSYRNLNHLMSLLIKSKIANIKGYQMLTDSNDSEGYSIKEYEANTVKHLDKWIKKGDWVIDVGASLGYYTILLRDIIGEEGRVFAFEPEKTNFQILDSNMELNGFQNIILNKCAITDKIGEDTLYVMQGAGSHVMYNEFREDSRQEKVKTDTLDNLFKNVHHKIAFIKMDIDGSEMRALKYAEQLIKRNPNIKLLIEFAPARIIDSGYTPREFLDYINSLGFEIKAMFEDNPEVVKGTFDKLMKNSTTMRNKMNWCNLICERKE